MARPVSETPRSIEKLPVSPNDLVTAVQEHQEMIADAVQNVEQIAVIQGWAVPDLQFANQFNSKRENDL